MVYKLVYHCLCIGKQSAHKDACRYMYMYLKNFLTKRKNQINLSMNNTFYMYMYYKSNVALPHSGI